ncbi:MAG: hypothetical protein H7039_13485 [Bryobacteraceae bacterium]|nr:hypothetical protein [Bryobacteraceae bacterium]
MTRPLRRVHLWIWLCLAFLIPALFGVSLLFRRDTLPRNIGVHGQGMDWKDTR